MLKRKWWTQTRREALDCYIFISPVIIGLLVFMIGPIFASIYISFTKYDILGSPKWIGLDNYKTLIHDPKKVTLDTTEAKNTMTFMNDLQYKFNVSPTAIEKNALGGNFYSGKIGMYIGGDWNLATAKTIKGFKWDLAPLPSWKGNRVVLYWVGGYAITTKSKHPDAAWQFIKWTMTDNQNTLAQQGSWIPVSKPILDNLQPPSWAPSGYKSARLDWMKYGI